MPASSGFDRSKFLSMREVLTRLGPGWNEQAVRRRIGDGRLPGQKIRGRNWFFPREATERAIAKIKATEDGVRLEPGELDSIAIAMLREGRSEGEVVIETKLPIDHVAKLRRSLGLESPSSGAMLASEPTTRSVRKTRAAAPVVDDRASKPDPFWDDWIKASRARMKDHAR